MAGFRWAYLGATLCVGLAAATKTATYFILRHFVDNVLTQSDIKWALMSIVVAFIGLAILQGGFTFLGGKLASRTAEGVVKRLRDYLYDHIQHLAFAYHDRTPTGELIERATSDVESIRRFYNDQAIGVGRIVLLFGINFGAVLLLNSRLAYLSVIVVPIVVATSALFFKRVSQVYESYQDQEAKLSTTLQENLTGVRVIKAFARQEYEQSKFDEDNWEKYQRGRKLVKMHALFWPVSDILCGTQMLGGLLLGALMAIDGAITIGTFVAYAGMLVWLIWPMRNLGRLIVQMSTGFVSFERVGTVLREVREPLHDGTYTPEGGLRGEVVFEDVSFAYGNDAPVLHDVSFRCEPGQAIALLGSTGSGKTSLVNLLPRFYDYTSGRVTLDGVELKEYSRHFLRQNIGIVEQEPFLFSRSLRENITYGVGRPVSDEEVEAAARAAAVHDVIMTFPKGYDTLVGEKGVTLSGGQKQRVAIARTLLRNPRILILDDSTSSVDLGTEGQIREALEYLMQGRTTFIIAHRVQSVMNADQILVLDEGRVVQRGVHHDLLAEDGFYSQIFRMQARVDVELDKEVADVLL
ncbi:MAG: ABC transporter ATP-binding protein [Chloroflexi bacterium]|nr:ABC transporter ATP-binding protein [Chloroflexota bacterium]